jgi:hypothetical protein
MAIVADWHARALDATGRQVFQRITGKYAPRGAGWDAGGGRHLVNWQLGRRAGLRWDDRADG